MSFVRILNRQVMKIKLMLNLFQNFLRRFMQAYPHKLVAILQHFVNILKVDIRLATPLVVCCTIDDLFHLNDLK